MPRSVNVLAPVLALAIATALTFTVDSSAQTVWSGLSLSFAKISGADPLLPANQDRITSNVWMTRGPDRGMVNAVDECSVANGCEYTKNFSPNGTEWATNLVPANAGQTIASTNWQQLTFTNWEAAYGNQVGLNILNRDAVVHLITDDIYLDLRFTSWAMQVGGGFAYQRSAAHSGTVHDDTLAYRGDPAGVPLKTPQFLRHDAMEA